jgi:hypothetical protein
MTALEIIKHFQPTNPGRKFAIGRTPQGQYGAGTETTVGVWSDEANRYVPVFQSVIVPHGSWVESSTEFRVNGKRIEFDWLPVSEEMQEAS